MEKEMIYLKKDDNIEELLEFAKNQGQFIYVNKLRCIGKTTALINFAKKYDLGVILPNHSMCEYIIKRFCYYNIFSCTDNIDNLLNKNLKGFVIDEGCKKPDIVRLMNNLTIVTGFINNEHIFDEYILNQIYSDKQTIKQLEINKTNLIKKLKIAQLDNNQSNYKMLINNLIKTIETINLIRSSNSPSYQLNIKTDLDAKSLSKKTEEYITNKLMNLYN